jgi:hypothetical protein
LLAAIAGCSLDKPFSEDDFACSAGGTCVEDSGVRDTGKDTGTGIDAQPMDAVPMDAQPMDAEPIVECINVTPLPVTGIASGDTSNQSSVYEGGCFPVGGRETVYGLTLPGRADITAVAISPSQTWYPALHVYRETCDATDRVGCAGADPEGDTKSTVVVNDAVAGDYAIVIDGSDAVSFGSFTLEVDAVIAAGELCEPNVGYQRCQVGACTMEGSVYRCPPIYDCMDGIDVDEDGEADEDACTNPPLVSCATTATAAPGSLLVLQATPTDDVGITNREWSIRARPVGSKAIPQSPNADSTVLQLDLAGEYRARYIAFDADNNTGACEVTVSATTAADIYVEMFWLEEPYADYDFDIHFLHPMALNWYDFDYACSIDNGCTVTWGTIPENNPLWSGDAPGNGSSVESVRLPRAEAGSYGIGLAPFTEPMPIEIFVNVYCGGLLRSFSSSLVAENLFWKIANVSVDANGCTIQEINSLVTQTEAMTAR